MKIIEFSLFFNVCVGFSQNYSQVFVRNPTSVSPKNPWERVLSVLVTLSKNEKTSLGFHQEKAPQRSLEDGTVDGLRVQCGQAKPKLPWLDLVEVWLVVGLYGLRQDWTEF